MKHEDSVTSGTPSDIEINTACKSKKKENGSKCIYEALGW
jgi:hypothetical protein